MSRSRKNRCFSVSEILSSKTESFALSDEFERAFGSPERTGVWFVWGRSGSGKSSFALQLSKELCRFGKVCYVSMEEGRSKSFKDNLVRSGMQEVKTFQVFDKGLPALEELMSKRSFARIIVIDSFQYTGFSFNEYKAFVARYPRNLFVFLSQADGNKPAGRTAVRVMYDASLKILVQGYKAFSKGRFIGATGEYTIWEKGAEEYWGKTEESEEVIIRQ